MSSQYEAEFRAACRQREQQRESSRSRGPVPLTDAQERTYHRAMAGHCVDRGFVNLAQSHLVAAKDCPRGCGCDGCESTRAEALELKRLRAKRQESRAKVVA